MWYPTDTEFNVISYRVQCDILQSSMWYPTLRILKLRFYALYKRGRPVNKRSLQSRSRGNHLNLKGLRSKSRLPAFQGSVCLRSKKDLEEALALLAVLENVWVIYQSVAACLWFSWACTHGLGKSVVYPKKAWKTTWIIFELSGFVLLIFTIELS